MIGLSFFFHTSNVKIKLERIKGAHLSLYRYFSLGEKQPVCYHKWGPKIAYSSSILSW